jgi:hypothetical protein
MEVPVYNIGKESKKPNSHQMAYLSRVIPAMAKKLTESQFKRKHNRYRLVVINDDTFEEVVTFKLTRYSVYVAFSSLFVLLTGLTIALLSFTNLRYLIPGYGKQGALKEIRELKMRTDSLERTSIIQQQYLNGIKKVLSGDSAMTTPVDTTMLNLPAVENEYQ